MKGGTPEIRLTWITLTQFLDRSRLLLLSNLLILLLIGGCFQALPWESTSQKVHEHMAQCFEVVSSRLLTSKMCIDGHVSSGAREGFAFPVRNVLFRLGVSILLCHAKVDDMYDVGSLGARSTDEEVVRFDVAIDQILFVYRLDPGQLSHD